MHLSRRRSIQDVGGFSWPSSSLSVTQSASTRHTQRPPKWIRRLFMLPASAERRLRRSNDNVLQDSEAHLFPSPSWSCRQGARLPPCSSRVQTCYASRTCLSRLVLSPIYVHPRIRARRLLIDTFSRGTWRARKRTSRVAILLRLSGCSVTAIQLNVASLRHGVD